MKKTIAIFLSLLICLSSAPLKGEEDCSVYAPRNTPETEALWANRELDEADTWISVSMLGWGLALAVGITIITLVVHQSSSHSHNHNQLPTSYYPFTQ